VELELIPVHKTTRTRALAQNDARASTADALSRVGLREGWREESNGEDPPSWKLADGARISFEPGGQLEISSAPAPTASQVIDSTQTLVKIIR